ncbi:Lectin-domain containing receptor kinase VI.3 [Thalictrum thalictroides]|uniref:Lectin-domain containing receptor kinase VI.3 n=1 Tax=Thalictrum thalictroides TaxID=46969 RepID=A0A7J6UUZ0_THATH|nr:Lectin-domain containing receptor kinase VI.3 [Thalictrum thalictroides]
MLKKRFKVWEGETSSLNNTNSSSDIVASFNSTFLVGFNVPKKESPGEGFAFVISPDLKIPSNSYARALEQGKNSYATADGVPGTFGYIAPETFHAGKATRDSDVFGFGAVVLEVVCGTRPWTKVLGTMILVDWVWKLYCENRILEAVDDKLGSDHVDVEAERILLLGIACCHPIASERPKPRTHCPDNIRIRTCS